MSAPSLKWPGSKWRLAEWVISNMPSHDAYLEPFFGSGAVFFNKIPSNVETINDRDSMVVNLFEVIRNKPAQIEAAIALTPWARAEYDECRKDLAQGDDVERARRLLVAMWQAVGVRRASRDDETSAGCSGWRARDSLHQSPIATWKRLPERLRVASARLLDAQIECRPALDVIARNRSSETLIYADPPYVKSTRGASAINGRRLYAHEMSDDGHLELIAALKNHLGPVLLSGYRCPLYDDNLDWECQETTSRIQTNQTRSEALWMNPVALRLIEEQCQQQELFQ